MEPAVLVDDFGGGLRVFVVAQHDTAAADADLAGLIDLMLCLGTGLAQCADVGRILLDVQQAVTGQLGHGIALVDIEAVLHQRQQNLGIQCGGAAAQVPQTIQAILMAAADFVIDHLDQHRRRGHGIARHQLDITVEVARVAADVQRTALHRVDPQADEAGQVEERHQREVAQRLTLTVGRSKLFLIIRNDLLAGDIHLVRGGVVALRKHDALAAAGGAGGEHQHQQTVRVDAVGQLAGLAVLVSVHRAQDGTVSSFQILPIAVVDAIVEDEGRLDQFQLIFQLRPGLLIVQGHEDSTREHGAEGQHTVLVAVPAQQGDFFALDIRDVLF